MNGEVRLVPRPEWVSLGVAAQKFGRSRKTIWTWCRNGTLSAFGVETYQDPKGRWHVYLPENGKMKKV